MTLTELADRLEKLDKKATRGPWEADSAESEGGSGRYHTQEMLDAAGRVIFEASNSQVAELHEELDDEDGHFSRWDETAKRNFAMIENLRNALPLLVAALRELASMRAVLGEPDPNVAMSKMAAHIATSKETDRELAKLEAR